MPSLGEIIRHRAPWIESSLGYRVRSTGRFELEYVDVDGLLHLDCEWMVAPLFVVHRDSIPPGRPEVLERVMRLWLWSGTDVDLSPPDLLPRS